MSPEVPAALALAGTGLLAMAFFGPFGRVADTDELAETPDENVLWPSLVDASATACGVPVRIDMADALGALRSPWAETILREAHDTEPDPEVRSAIAAALRQGQDRPAPWSSTQSLVM